MTRREYPRQRETGAVGGMVLTVVAICGAILLVWLIATGRTLW